MPWLVLYEDALRAWESSDRPHDDRLIAVLEWLMQMVESGPPDHALPVPLVEDLYISRVPGTDILVTYLALAYERRVVIRRIG